MMSFSYNPTMPPESALPEKTPAMSCDANRVSPDTAERGLPSPRTDGNPVKTREFAEKGCASTCGEANTSELKLSRNKRATPLLDHSSGDTTTGYTRIDDMLMREKASNKLDTWVKMDKVSRLSRLSAFSSEYGRAESWSLCEIDSLREFLSESLTKGRLKRASEVIYNRTTQEISAIPCLEITRADADALSFSLGAINPKRPTAIKSLTPKRLLTSSGIVGKDARSNEMSA
jgi:hypothetical protein